MRTFCEEKTVKLFKRIAKKKQKFEKQCVLSLPPLPSVQKWGKKWWCWVTGDEENVVCKQIVKLFKRVELRNTTLLSLDQKWVKERRYDFRMVNRKRFFTKSLWRKRRWNYSNAPLENWNIKLVRSFI